MKHNSINPMICLGDDLFFSYIHSKNSYSTAFECSRYLYCRLFKKIGDREELLADCNLNDNGSIWDFEVVENSRNKGYGRKLFETVIDFIKKTYPDRKQIIAYCEIDNRNALMFWKAVGMDVRFNEVEEVYWKQAVKMVFKLS